MKAISLHQPCATMIRNGRKTIETRTWGTSYRGPLLICSSKNPQVEGHLCGFALCVAELVDCRPMRKADEARAACDLYEGAWAWILEDIRPVEPFRVRGFQRIFEVDCESRLPKQENQIPPPAANQENPMSKSVHDPRSGAKKNEQGASLKQIFEAYAKIDVARGEVASARDGYKEAKDAAAAAKERLTQAEDRLEAVREAVLGLIGLARDAAGAKAKGARQQAESFLKGGSPGKQVEAA